MTSPALPRRGPSGAKLTSLLLAAASALAIALVLYLNGEDNRTMCDNHAVNVPWSRVVLTYGGLAMALAALVVAGRLWWTGRTRPVRPRRSLAMLIVTGLLVGMAGLTVISTHQVLDGAAYSRQSNTLVVCT